MSTHASEQAVFRALSDPTRRSIIGMLETQPMTVHQITAHFEMSRPAIAKHLGILQDSEIITVRASGRERINTLQPLALKSATQWLNHYSHFWDEKLLALKSTIEKANKA